MYSIIDEALDGVSIATDEVELDSVEEIADLHRDSLSHLQFVGYVDKWPNLFLYVLPNSIQVIIMKGDLLSLGTLGMVKKVLTRHKPSFWSSSLFNSFASGGLLGSAVLFILKGIQKADSSIIIPASLVALVAALWWYWVTFRKPKNKVILKYYDDSPSF